MEDWKSLLLEASEEVAGEVTVSCSFPGKRGREAALRSFADGHRERFTLQRVRGIQLLMDLYRLSPRDLLLKSTYLQYSFNGLHINVHDGLKQERGKQCEFVWVFYSLIGNKHALSKHLITSSSLSVMQVHSGHEQQVQNLWTTAAWEKQPPA